MNKREVVVNIGYKSDGVIPLNEFRYNPDLKVGDTVEVYRESGRQKGTAVLSHKKARAARLGSASTRLLRARKSSRASSNAAPRVA
jgi:ribosomal protein S1